MNRRIAILGNSGSGKSTLANRLGAERRLPVLDLDTVVWEPGKIGVARSRVDADRELAAFIERDGWIVEGCYAELVAMVLPRRPLLILLDPGLEVCREHCRARPWEPHKYATEALQDAHLAFLLEWVAEYYVRDGPMSLRAHRRVFDDYDGPKIELRERVDARTRLP